MIISHLKEQQKQLKQIINQKPNNEQQQKGIDEAKKLLKKINNILKAYGNE